MVLIFTSSLNFNDIILIYWFETIILLTCFLLFALIKNIWAPKISYTFFILGDILKIIFVSLVFFGITFIHLVLLNQVLDIGAQLNTFAELLMFTAAFFVTNIVVLVPLIFKHSFACIWQLQNTSRHNTPLQAGSNPILRIFLMQVFLLCVAMPLFYLKPPMLLSVIILITAKTLMELFLSRKK